LAAAIAARQGGLTVVVADGGVAPIDKACGEGLMPDSRRAAEKIGISISDEAGMTFRGIRFLDRSESVAAEFPHGTGLGVRRTRLHNILTNTALSVGVELRWAAPVTGIGGIAARWIVGADGSASRVRRWANLDARRWRSRRFAYRQHFDVAPWSEYMEIHWSEGCQAYVTPISAKEVCVALIARTPELRLNEALTRYFPALSSRLKYATLASRELGAVTENTRLRSVARSNVALIGDASGSVDAITGEGLCLIFKQADALAVAMTEGDLSSYDYAHPRLSTRAHVMGEAMLMLDRGPLVRRVAIGAMSRQPWIFKSLLAAHVA